MSIKAIERIVYYCNQLLAAFKLNNKEKISKWLNQFEKENNEELISAKEFGIKYLLSLHGMIAREINKIKGNLNNPAKCINFVNAIIQSLAQVVDQREVRDKIIKETIHPIMKNLGYKKKKRSFVKKEGRYFKKLNVYTSKTSEYFDVEFIFEIDIEGPGVNYISHRVSEKWFKLNQDIDLEKIKAEIEAYLINYIKPFLDKFR